MINMTQSIHHIVMSSADKPLLSTNQLSMIEGQLKHSQIFPELENKAKTSRNRLPSSSLTLEISKSNLNTSPRNITTDPTAPSTEVSPLNSTRQISQNIDNSFLSFKIPTKKANKAKDKKKAT